MVTDLRTRLSRSRLSVFLLAATAVVLIGLLLGLPALADPGQPVPPPGRGHGSESGAASVAPQPGPQQGANGLDLALTVLPSAPAQPPEPTATPPVVMDERDQEFIDITPVKLPEGSLGALTPPPCSLHT
jgi:hypothetical protein